MKGNDKAQFIQTGRPDESFVSVGTRVVDALGRHGDRLMVERDKRGRITVHPMPDEFKVPPTPEFK